MQCLKQKLSLISPLKISYLSSSTFLKESKGDYKIVSLRPSFFLSIHPSDLFYGSLHLSTKCVCMQKTHEVGQLV